MVYEILICVGIIIFIGIVLILGVVTFIYNSLINLRERGDNAWAQINVQLKRRFDLIPNLIETIKGYAKHEKITLTDITKARSAWQNASTPKEKAKAENMLQGALKSLFAVVENYPQLKANANFMDLQNQLEKTEDKIAYARQFYNDIATEYNIRVQKIPYNLIAGPMGFKERELFEINEQEKQNIKVKF